MKMKFGKKLPAYHTSVVVAFVAAVLATLIIILSGCSSTPAEPYGDWRDYNQVDWSPEPQIQHIKEVKW